jgi:hypothetical protein
MHRDSDIASRFLVWSRPLRRRTARPWPRSRGPRRRWTSARRPSEGRVCLSRRPPRPPSAERPSPRGSPRRPPALRPCLRRPAAAGAARAGVARGAAGPGGAPALPATGLAAAAAARRSSAARRAGGGPRAGVAAPRTSPAAPRVATRGGPGGSGRRPPESGAEWTLQLRAPTHRIHSTHPHATDKRLTNISFPSHGQARIHFWRYDDETCIFRTYFWHINPRKYCDAR